MEPFVIILFVYGTLYALTSFVPALESVSRIFFPLPRAILILPGKHLSNPNVIKGVRVVIGLVIIGLGFFIQWKLAHAGIPNV